MASSPPQTSPPRNDDFNVDSPMNAIDSPAQRSHRSSMRSSMQPRTPNANVRQVSRAARPPAIVQTDETGAYGGGGMGLDSDIESSEAGNMGGVIWGTNINVEHIQRQFLRFIENYRDNKGALVYSQLIEDAIESQTYCVALNCNDLYSYNKDLYNKLVKFPQEVLPSFDVKVNEYAADHFSSLFDDLSEFGGNGMNGPQQDDIWVRPYNLRDVRSMRDMNPTDIDKLVGIRGMVIRSSAVIPDIQTAFFRCQLCQYEIEVPIDLGRIVEPTKCNNNQCQGSNCMELIHNRSTFQDKQLVKLQETPENIPDGETPQTIDVFCFDSLVDKCKPGDRIEVTGLYRASAIRRNPRLRVIESVYKTYIDAVHISKIRNNSLMDGDNEYNVANKNNNNGENENENDLDMDMDMDSELNMGGAGSGASAGIRNSRENEIKELANDENVYQRLTNSFAPSIFEMEDIKKGILCQLFGASRKNFGGEYGGASFRNQLNVLLCGDPGTSKSQLLQYVHKVAPRGIYTSGKGSSAVGLTAYITKDPDSGDLVLESGALVLSDRGICCIDEFDKMSESARSILLEVMEQQTVSIAKAGIICTLNARTSILAAANPRESRYNPKKPVVENIDLPPTLMSRFDLIYLVLDRPNETLDRLLARHIVSLYYDDNNGNGNASGNGNENERGELIDNDLFMKYIDYSKRNFNPALTDEAAERLVQAYTDLRDAGRNKSKKIISATPRQLESLIRISESLARMRHSKSVTVDDVNEALRLHRVSTLTAATDPNTGEIDLDQIAVGRTQEQGRELQNQASIVMQVLQNHRGRTIRAAKLLKKYNDFANDDESGNIRQINMNKLKEIVERLEQEERLRANDWTVDDPYISITNNSLL